MTNPADSTAAATLAAVAMIRADLQNRPDDMLMLANSSNPLTVAVMAHLFSQVLAQLSRDPEILLDAMTSIYTSALADED